MRGTWGRNQDQISRRTKHNRFQRIEQKKNQAHAQPSKFSGFVSLSRDKQDVVAKSNSGCCDVQDLDQARAPVSKPVSKRMACSPALKRPAMEMSVLSRTARRDAPNTTSSYCLGWEDRFRLTRRGNASSQYQPRGPLERPTAEIRRGAVWTRRKRKRHESQRSKDAGENNNYAHSNSSTASPSWERIHQTPILKERRKKCYREATPTSHPAHRYPCGCVATETNSSARPLVKGRG